MHVYPGGQAVVGNVKTTGKNQLEGAGAQACNGAGQALLADAPAEAERRNAVALRRWKTVMRRALTEAVRLAAWQRTN